MFRMPFAEQLGLMREALEFIKRRSSEVEEILRSSGRQDPNSLKIDVKRHKQNSTFKKKTLVG